MYNKIVTQNPVRGGWVLYIDGMQYVIDVIDTRIVSCKLLTIC